MKPFDLEAAKAGKPLVTRDGRPARFIAHLPECEMHSRVLFHITGTSSSSSCSESGSFFGVKEQHSSQDLFIADMRRTIYLNLYWDKGSKNFVHGAAHDSAEKAQEAADAKAIAVAVPVEIEE